MNDHIPDATKMISDTPRMQSALLDHPDAGFAKIWQVGCEIERELDAANQIIRQQQLLDEENLRLQDRIKRLEEALTEIELAMKQPASNHRFMQIAGPARQVINIIKKAKEAKP